MLISQQNRLLPLLAAMVLLILVLVLSRSCTDKEPDSVLLDRVPEASSPDADSPADTIKTLTANVAAMTTELQQLRQANAELRRDNQTLHNDSAKLEENVSRRIADEFAALQDDNQRSAWSELSARIDALSASRNAPAADLRDHDMPIGLGLDTAGAQSDWVWIAPLDADASPASTALLQRLGHRSDTSAKGAMNAQGSASPEEATEDRRPIPVYTVPRNATLMGATAMTALLGRVPLRGEVRDAMPFKVITGIENLAANGLTVPGVEGMIWSGTAVGDWTLSCVSGRLESVTFVFNDGHIRTISSDDRTNESANANRPLGWISDAQGIPCVSGQRKSNAAAFLTQRIGVKAIEAAGEAAAAAQTTTVVRDSGALSSAVSGNSGDFVLGKTLGNGSNEIAKWLLERQAQNFDAVFVPAGAKIAIHVDRELSIDLDPNARRLDYATLSTEPKPHRLD